LGRDTRPTRTARTIAGFVTMKGGEYFFSPSFSGLERLAPSAPVIKPDEP
jgi:hypothetical protein